MSARRTPPFSLASFNRGVGALEERQNLRTTHLRVWAGSQIMLTWLIDHAEELGLLQPGTTIIELGSGTGWMLLNLACLLPNLHVTLSEQQHAIAALQSNVDWACAEEPSLLGRVEVLALAWEDVATSALSAAWDFIVGCDLLYSEDTLRTLPNALHGLMQAAGPATRCFYAHTPRRKRFVDEQWRQAFAQHGLSVEPVPDDDGALSAAGHPPPADAASRAASDKAWLPDGGLFAEEDAQVREDPLREGLQIFSVCISTFRGMRAHTDNR